MGQYEEYPISFKNFMRMDPAMFKELLARVGSRIEKEDTFWRRALDPGLKLVITLRYLATGNSYRSLMHGFRVAFNTICNLIPDVCEAIIQEYVEEVLSCPTSPEEWKHVADLFASRWNFPHCVGVVAGKHVAIRCPVNGGSVYFNYNGVHSIALMAVVDADYSNCRLLPDHIV